MNNYNEFDMDTRGDTLHPSLRVRVYDGTTRYITTHHYGVAYTLGIKTRDMLNDIEYFKANNAAFNYCCDVLASAWATSLDRRMYRACQIMDKKPDDIEDNI